ncbi:DUF938 domain-containing protein [Amphritea japonica]|uniref:Methylase n=1 Tax=Amphritea japonica ATCC BAA-1530 TaxID=1278309 RepID=A0A7R6P6H1_9GAMM|nr:DUF938 domain-containing protein [Amphritea japonica]BBB26874.1 conserved hypothetical protein [Amphritea japonica ATCC BAA-1530]
MVSVEKGWVNFAPAAERNQAPILSELQKVLGGAETIIEVGSGSGQHALYFCKAMHELRWIPTEIDELLPVLTTNLKSYVDVAGYPPRLLDLRDPVWHKCFSLVDAIYSANTLHIVSWSEVISLFEGSGKLLEAGGKLILYGPFRYDGRYTSDSNAEFDRWLKRRCEESGIRDFEKVNELAEKAGLKLLADIEMPANNQLLVWKTG